MTIEDAVESIVARRRDVPDHRSVLVAITGIDGAGKGWVTARVAATLEQRGLRVANLNIDGWLNLPHVRFDDENPAGHFYRHAIRFDELFAELVLPLRDHRSICLDADHAEETATTYRRQRHEFSEVDVILLEGIYLLKRELRSHYDLSFWIACGFGTALARAIARAQECLPPDQTAAAYERIYFPAQRLHFELDDPQAAATAVIDNDSSGPVELS